MLGDQPSHKVSVLMMKVVGKLLWLWQGVASTKQQGANQGGRGAASAMDQQFWGIDVANPA